MSDECNCVDDEVGWCSTLQYVMHPTTDGEKEFPSPLYVCEGCNTEVPMVRESHLWDDLQSVLLELGEMMAKYTPDRLIENVTLREEGPLQMNIDKEE